jgi:hypothetical protein
MGGWGVVPIGPLKLSDLALREVGRLSHGERQLVELGSWPLTFAPMRPASEIPALILES